MRHEFWDHHLECGWKWSGHLQAYTTALSSALRKLLTSLIITVKPSTVITQCCSQLSYNDTLVVIPRQFTHISVFFLMGGSALVRGWIEPLFCVCVCVCRWHWLGLRGCYWHGCESSTSKALTEVRECPRLHLPFYLVACCSQAFSSAQLHSRYTLTAYQTRKLYAWPQAVVAFLTAIDLLKQKENRHNMTTVCSITVCDNPLWCLKGLLSFLSLTAYALWTRVHPPTLMKQEFTDKLGSNHADNAFHPLCICIESEGRHRDTGSMNANLY